MYKVSGQKEERGSAPHSDSGTQAAVSFPIFNIWLLSTLSHHNSSQQDSKKGHEAVFEVQRHFGSSSTG